MRLSAINGCVMFVVSIQMYAEVDFCSTRPSSLAALQSHLHTDQNSPFRYLLLA